ncbi:hypothetical protein GCM10009788_52330 [Nocardioides humi]|uniref:Uncharacterized protein n=1 Tax=Nocardioides humi TaxID=449461 RepID=A0ABN2BLB5_9ACTN
MLSVIHSPGDPRVPRCSVCGADSTWVEHEDEFWMLGEDDTSEGTFFCDAHRPYSDKFSDRFIEPVEDDPDN